jgi:hypothetical protein
MGARGGDRVDALHALLADPDPLVAAAACRAAAKLRNRASVFGVARLMADYRVRGAAIDALVGYGSAICGTLGDIMDDNSLPAAIRANIPRVLRRIPHQRSVDILLGSCRHPQQAVRVEALKSLTRLRQEAPGLTFGSQLLKPYILNDAHHYYELAAIAAALEQYRSRRHSAVSLLVRTLDDRVAHALERLFQLLGISYPAAEMEWTHSALASEDKDRHSAAIDFLDNILDKELKRVVLPIFDAPARVLESGHTLFGVERLDAEGAIANLVNSDDPWIASCAIAAAAELKLRSLADEIANARLKGHLEVKAVAMSAVDSLGAASGPS